jgi:hypothetical protein
VADHPQWCILPDECDHAAGGGVDGADGLAAPLPLPHAPTLVPWIPLDPAEECPEPPLELHPHTVRVQAGEMLYVPPMVYHRVSQGGTAAEPTIAVNWWYDMDYGAPWAMARFAQEVHEIVGAGASDQDEGVGVS